MGIIGLPLTPYIFCGRHLLAAKLRRANTDASAGSVEELERIVTQIRRHWPEVRIVLRADSGFARDALIELVRRDFRTMLVRKLPKTGPPASRRLGALHKRNRGVTYEHP